MQGRLNSIIFFSKGVFGLDSAPLDHRNFEAFHELKSVVDTAYNFRLKDKSRAEIEERLKKEVEVIIQ